MKVKIRFTNAEESIQGYTFRSFAWRYECPNCGKRATDIFCPRCGEKLEYTNFPEGHIRTFMLDGKWYVDERESHIEQARSE